MQKREVFLQIYGLLRLRRHRLLSSSSLAARGRHEGQECHAINTPTWSVMLGNRRAAVFSSLVTSSSSVQNILGYLGILQIIGTIFEASGVEVDNIEYNQLAQGKKDFVFASRVSLFASAVGQV